MSRSEKTTKRRKERERRKQKEASDRRHGVKTFLGVSRRFAEGDYFGDYIPNPDREGFNADAWRFLMEDFCSSMGAKLGESGSWGYLYSCLEQAGASDDVQRSFVEKWLLQHPQAARPRMWLVIDRYIHDLFDDSLRLIRQGLKGQAAADFQDELDDFYTRNGYDLVDEVEAEAKTSRLVASVDQRVRSAGIRLDSKTRSRGRQSKEKPEARRSGPANDDSRTKPPDSAPVLASLERDVLNRIERAITSFSSTAAVAFESLHAGGVLDRLRRGPHDAPGSLELARRGVEFSAADHYDRILSLDVLQGVDQLGYQLETVFRVLKRFRGRVLLADEVGLGKTIEACLVLKEYMLRGQVRRALVLVPPALVGQWQAELEEKFSIRSITTRSSRLRSDPGGFWSSPGVIVASLATARAAAHRDRVAREKFDLVIVDEAHHLKNRRTRGWELVNSIRSRFFLMLTATPVETDLSELYNLVTLLRPGTLGTEPEFRRRFVNPRDPTQPVDPGRLRELLREVMVRNTRALCGIHLPPRTVRTISVEPTAEERALYDRIVDVTRSHGGRRRSLFRLLLEEGGSSPMAVARTARRALEKADDDRLRPALLQVAEAAKGVTRTSKLERLPDLLEGGKTLLFTRFRETMSQIAKFFDDREIQWIEFHGGLNGPQKDDAVRAFEEQERSVMICSEIGGEGRNLQFCHRLINFDLPWNPMSIEQRVGRIHRIGQTETVEVVNLVSAGTAEERILDVLDRRIQMFELVIGEMDLLLGNLEDEREFGECVFDIYAGSQSSADLEQGFDDLAGRLLKGRQKLEKTRALDEALFGEDYEA